MPTGSTFSPARVPGFSLTLAIILLAACSMSGRKQSPAVPAPESVRCFDDITRVLSDDAMEGRGVGTRGLDLASDYLAQRFHGLGLEDPAQDFRQPFEVVTGVGLGERNRLRWNDEEARLRRDFIPLGFTSSRAFEGSLVFAGYGIVAEPLGYDDYSGMDVAGKVVLAMRYEPGESDPDSPFDGKRPSRYSDLRYKAMKAREAGAAALIFVYPPGEEEDRLPRLRQEGPVSDAGIPVLQIKRALAEVWLGAAGQSLARLHAAIDADQRPRSLAIPELRIRGHADVVATTRTVANVVGVLPGRGALVGEHVVVGAHYDHLGFGGSGSVTPDLDAVHNGADDNASGVAAMLCSIPQLRERSSARDSHRTLVVIGFTAEEIGLGGSVWYVEHPVLPLARASAMVNLDMVGRLRDDKLYALGETTAPEWAPLLDQLGAQRELDIRASGDGYGPSDQMAFYSRGVPVIHLFTGAHSEYHSPADDHGTLVIEGGGRVSELLGDLLLDLLVRGDRLSYRESSESSTMLGDSRGFGAYLGTIPDYSEMMASEGGVLLSGVRAGGPADRAGLRGGDRIVEMSGVEIRNLYDMTFVLRDHKPGDVIRIAILRKGRRLERVATLGRRGESPEPGGAHGSGHEGAKD